MVRHPLRKHSTPPTHESPTGSPARKRAHASRPEDVMIAPRRLDYARNNPNEVDDDVDESSTDDEDECLPHLLFRFHQFDSDSSDDESEDDDSFVSDLAGAFDSMRLSDFIQEDEPPPLQEDDAPTGQQTQSAKAAHTMTSICHDAITNNKLIAVSLDLETGGENCGVTQISAVAFKLDGSAVGDDFDRYVKPPRSAKWDQRAVNLTGLPCW